MNVPATTSPRTGMPGALRRAVRRPSRSALIKDLVLYVVLAFPVASGTISPADPGHLSWWLPLGGLVVLGAAIAVSRTWPTAALLTAIVLISVHGNFTFAMPVLAYLTGRRTNRAQPLLWGFAAVSLGGAGLAIVRGMDVTTWFPSTVWLVLLGVLPWLVGRYWRQYQELLRAGWERAEHLEHEQRITAERERLRERARIAQDMHDSLGHELALIAVRAGALQVAAGLDDPHRAAAAQLRAGAAEATEQLREIIGVLHEDTGPAPDGPTLHALDLDGTSPDGVSPVRPARESIPELVERARASGVPVRLTDDSAPCDGSGEPGPSSASGLSNASGLPSASGLPDGLAPMVALAAHRIVQEAVTNAAKHAPGAAITVHLAHREPAPDQPGMITVTVTNEPPSREPAPATSGGHGLTGLTERVRLLGGTLRAGPTSDGGFTVTADLPTATPAPTARTALRTALGLTTPAPGHWPSESARRLDHKRRQVRRGLITAIAVPTGLMAVLGAIMAGYYIFATLNSVLPPGDYAALRVGAPQTTVEDALPRMEAMGADVVRTSVTEPPHADCRYYRPDASLIGVNRYYRLCFTDGRLTHKDSYDTNRLSSDHPNDTDQRRNAQ
ncbi:histidine kinase [Actinomadura meridiana]|uniref:histidine kinase n=1 Tax=Actinomadura meridiana TaxID=559626 RepID=A0ABP8BUH1_9ACTN